MKNIKYKEIILYLIIGILTTIINYIAFLFCPFNTIVSTIIAWILSVTFAYFSNKHFVFYYKKNDKKKFFKFLLSRIFSLILDISIMFIFVDTIKLNKEIMKLISNIIIVIVNYITTKFLIFRKS